MWKYLNIKNLSTLGLLVISVICLAALTPTRDESPADGSDADSTEVQSRLSKEQISAKIGTQVKDNEFPTTIHLKSGPQAQEASVEYSIDQEAQARVEKLFKIYKPDYGAFVAIDARTGRILSMASYSREDSQANLALQATFPAASVFKLVTASAAIDTNKANAQTIVPFNGGSHTLYRRNVEDSRKNRWTRYMTLREAFGRSVNTFFGKLGLYHVGPEVLQEYADRFRFNSPIPSDFPIEAGQAMIPSDDPWGVVEAASGFTLQNTLSPVHGALLAAAVANDGIMMEPYLVESVVGEDGGALYNAEPRTVSVILNPDTAAEIRDLMRETIRAGTSTKAFRRISRSRQFSDVEMGGKTGSLTGLNPRGKTDWFVGYVRYKDRAIAISAVTVHERIWRVKSSQFASEFLSTYIPGIKALERTTAHVQ